MTNLNNIVAATDSSARALRAVNRAAQLCQQLPAALHLLTVKEAGLPDAMARVMNVTPENARAAIHEQIKDELRLVANQLFDNTGVDAGLLIGFGDAAREIAAQAAALPAELTVIGAHGGNFFSDLFLGNTAERLLRITRTPLLIVKQEPLQPYREVLVPVDFSEDSRRAAMMALAIAPQAHISFLHAYDVGDEAAMRYSGLSADVIKQSRVAAGEQARLQLNQFVDTLGIGARSVSREPVFGLPSPAIREQAERRPPDLIVVGKHGKSRFEEFVLGSVTRDAVNRLPCDILVVPAPPGHDIPLP